MNHYAQVRPRVPARYVVIVTGSREWSDDDKMRARLHRYPGGYVRPVTRLYHGGAPGADASAHFIGRDLGFDVRSETFFEDLGKACGHARNALLVDIGCTYARHGYIVVVEAFPTASSRGTWDCVNRARSAGLQVEITHG